MVNFPSKPFEFWFEGIVQPKMKILSSFTHPQVVPNLYEFFSVAKHKRRHFEDHW